MSKAVRQDNNDDEDFLSFVPNKPGERIVSKQKDSGKPNQQASRSVSEEEEFLSFVPNEVSVEKKKAIVSDGGDHSKNIAPPSSQPPLVSSSNAILESLNANTLDPTGYFSGSSVKLNKDVSLPINPKTIPTTPYADKKSYTKDLQKRIITGTTTPQDEQVLQKNREEQFGFTQSDDEKLNQLAKSNAINTSFKTFEGSNVIPANEVADAVSADAPVSANPFTEKKKLINATSLKIKDDIRKLQSASFNESPVGRTYTPVYEKEIEDKKKELAEVNNLNTKLAFEQTVIGQQELNAIVRTDNSGNTLNRLADRLKSVLIGNQQPLNDEVEDNLRKLPTQAATGLSYWKNAEPVKFERISENIKNGLPISETEIAQLTNVGIEVERQSLSRDLVTNRITPQQYDVEDAALNKAAYNNLVSNKETLRAVLADEISERLYQKNKSILGSAIGNVWNYTPEEIQKEGEIVAKEKFGLDASDGNIKSALNYIKDNEGILPGANALAKSGALRELGQGVIEPIKGIFNSVGDLAKSPNDIYAEAQSQGNVEVAQKRLHDEDVGWRGVTNDVIKGLGQFATQAALAYATSGVLGEAGAALKATTMGATTAGAEIETANIIGSKILASKDVAATFITSYAQAYDSNLKNALNYTSDNKLAKSAAVFNSSLEAATELFLSPLDIAKGVASKLKSKGTTEGILKILSSKNILENPDKLKGFVKKTIKGVLGTSEVVGAEIGEEAVTQVADYVTNAVLNPNSKTFEDRNLASELATTAYQTGLSMAIPALLNGVGASRANTFSKGSLVIAAQNRQALIDSLKAQLKSGDLSQDEFNDKSAIINTAHVANETLPNKADGNKLSADEKADYIFSRTTEGVLRTRIENSKDEAEKSVYEEKIKEQHIFRKNILNGEIPESEKEPVYKVDDIPVEKEVFVAELKGENSNEKSFSVEGDEEVRNKLRNVGGVDENISEDQSVKKEGFQEAGEKSKNTQDATHIGRWMLDNSQEGDVVSFQDNGYEVTGVTIKKDGTKELVITPFELSDDGTKEYNNSGVKIISEQSIKNGFNLFENAYTDSKGERVIEQSVYEVNSENTEGADKEPELTLSEVIDKPGVYKGNKGRFYQDGNTVVFKVDGKEKEYELGNVEELKNTPISDLGIILEKSVVAVNDNGDITIRDTPYVNNFSDPLAAINYDEDGNIVSVNMETSEGKKRTFRGNIAEDIAYQINLKEITKSDETRESFERYINANPEIRTQINNEILSATPKESSVVDNEKLPEKQEEKRPLKENNDGENAKGTSESVQADTTESEKQGVEDTVQSTATENGGNNTKVSTTIPVVNTKTIKQLEAENKSTLPKVPTNKIFLNDVQVAPREDVSKVNKYFDSETTNELPKENVNINDIIPTQKNLTISNLEKTQDVKGGKEAIVLLKKGDKYYVLDGHHRVANKILKGDSSIEAHVYNANDTPNEGGMAFKKMTIQDFTDNILDMAVNMKDSGFDWRLSIPEMSQAQREKAVNDIRNGKDSIAAKKLRQFIQEMYDEGAIKVNRGRGNMAERATFPFEEWFGEPLTQEELNSAANLDEDVVRIINEEGITADNIDNFKNLFNGFPYTEEEFNSVKSYLTGQGESISENEESSETVEGKSESEQPITETIKSKEDENKTSSKTDNEAIAEKTDANEEVDSKKEQPLEKEVVPSENTEDGLGITHAQTSEILDEFGLPSYEKETQTFDKWDAEARERIMNGDMPALLNKLREAGQPSAVEVRMLGQYVANLKEVASKTKLDEDIARMHEAIKLSDFIGGTENARALVARKGLFKNENSLADFFQEEMDANAVGVLTDGQKGIAEKEHTEIVAAQKAWDVERERLNAKINQLEAERKIQEEKKSASRKVSKKNHEDYVKERNDIIQKAKEKIEAARLKANSPNAPKAQGFSKRTYIDDLFVIAPDVAKLVKSLVQEGMSKLSDVVYSVHQSLKESIPEITEGDVRDLIAGAYNEKRKTKSQISKDLFDLRTEAGLINKLDALLRGEQPKSEKLKIKRNREITDLRNKIKDFESAKVSAANEIKKAQAAEERLIKEFAKEVDAKEKSRLRSELLKQQDLLKELNKKTPEEVVLAAYKTRTEKQIKKLEEDLKSGNFDEISKPKILKLDKEALDAKDKLIKLKNERQLRLLQAQYASRTNTEKAMEVASNILNIPRSLMTTLDFSAVLRQGLIPTISNPRMAAKAGLQMFKSAWTQKEYDRWFYDLENSENFNLMKESGLALTDNTNPVLTVREENFMSNLTERIPIVGQALKVGEVTIPGMNLVKKSERAYSAYINKMRVDLFNNFAVSMRDRGLDFENSPEQYKQMAEYVNNATGRGSLGDSLNKVSPLLNGLFFSPRLMASRLNMLTYLAQPRFYKSVPKEVRRSYFKDMGLLLAVGATVLALSSIGGGNGDDEDYHIELDPRSADFGKIVRGNTRWDIWGGFQPYIRVVAQALSGERKSTSTGEIVDLDEQFGSSRADVLLSFARGKLAPVPGMAVDLFSKRTASGDKILFDFNQQADVKEITISDYVKDHLLPLTYTGVKDAVEDQGAKAVFTVGLPGLFGVGTQVYK